MTFREKMAWITLVVTVVIWGGYFGEAVRAVLAGAAQHLPGLFAACVAAQIALTVAAAIPAAAFAPRDAEAPEDERERLISLRATNLAFPVLSAGVLVVAGAFAMGAADMAALPISASLLMANGVLAAVVIAEIVRGVAQVVRYRQEAALG